MIYPPHDSIMILVKEKISFAMRCLGALFYDLLVLTAIFFLFTFVCLGFTHGEAVAPGTFWFRLSLILLAYLYYYFSYRYGGQTLGQKAWRIKLASRLSPLKMWQVVIRMILVLPESFLRLLTFNKIHKLNLAWSKTKLVDATRAKKRT